MAKQKTWLDNMTISQIRFVKGEFTFYPPKEAPRKRIDSRLFRLYAANPIRKDAQALAAKIHKRGFLARVIKPTNRRGYEIWIADKGRRA